MLNHTLSHLYMFHPLTLLQLPLSQQSSHLPLLLIISSVNSVSLNRNLLSPSFPASLFSTAPSVRTSENNMTSSVSTPYASVAASVLTSFNKPPASVSVPHNAIATSASSGLPLQYRSRVSGPTPAGDSQATRG